MAFTQVHTLSVQCRDENDEIKRAEVKIEVICDTEAIATYLGRKALRNKSKNSKLAVGVTASIIRGIPTGWRTTGY